MRRILLTALHIQRNPSSPQTPTEHRPLTPLSYLSSPVPDLAATLHTHTEDSADEANVSFLRDSLEWLAHAEGQSSRRRRGTQLNTQSASTYTSSGGTNSGLSAVSASMRVTSEDTTRLEHLQRVLARLNRIHEPRASTARAEASRTPSPLPRGLHGWSHNDESNSRIDADFDTMLTELRRQQPDTHPDILHVLGRRRMREQRLQRVREAEQSEMAEVAEWRRERDLRRRRDNEPDSLRSRALMLSARQEVYNTSGAANGTFRHVIERERSGISEEEERASSGGWFGLSLPSSLEPGSNPPPMSSDNWLLPVPASERAQRRQERIDMYRRAHPSDTAQRLSRTTTPPVPQTISPRSSSSMPRAPFVDNALHYLSALRTCQSHNDEHVADNGETSADIRAFVDEHEDCIMDVDSIPYFASSSWLQPGTLFVGDQHAAINANNLTHRRPNSASHLVEQINPHFLINRSSTVDDQTGSRLSLGFRTSQPSHSSHQAAAAPSITQSLPKGYDPALDHWPVRVVIHAVNIDSMTLQGTMEAYDVPQQPNSLTILGTPGGHSDRPRAGKKASPITTYFEGHIIDMRTHSFLTPQSSKAAATTGLDAGITFPAASARIDTSNWRKIPPFDALSSDDHFGRTLLSQTSMAEAFNDYIFMRWKERCFVHAQGECCTGMADGDHDRGHGLTISGFYYISLRRSDGAVHGLYFDPFSTPYQHLRLNGVVAGWPAFQLR